MSVVNTAQQSELALARMGKLFRGLSDPSRLAILRVLERGPLNVTAIVEATGLTQSNASTHLHCLWCCGLVQKERRGRFVYYRIRTRKVAPLIARAEALLSEVAAHIDACSNYGGPLGEAASGGCADDDGCGAH